ncbi:hypothetical protein OOZ63_19790 [Paucibacter sp. PLA-PC-4]|nr:hypothetical protein [Paucibacter sp. PLA-PC-4]MCX2864073.1 hypothetical protein [Paucibacter sp. PLA-PC-4]
MNRRLVPITSTVLSLVIAAISTQASLAQPTQGVSMAFNYTDSSG